MPYFGSGQSQPAAMLQLLGDEVADRIRIYAGDIVPKKKPDPAIYSLAAKELGVEAHK
jgi:beta-phosphoglucomutase-like phosphatase (HAD superfamily)